MNWLRFVSLVVVVGIWLPWQSHSPIQAQVCAPKEPQASLQTLRRLSLDLRGQAPTFSELQQVVTAKKVPDTLVDGMIKSPQMLDQLRRYHMDLLWGNIDNIRFANVAWSLAGNGTTAPYYISSVGRRIKFRNTAVVTCLNEPATKDASGNYVTKEEEVTELNGKKVMAKREGYVMVRPYWEATTTVKVCAFDAQETLTVPHPTGGTAYQCQTYTGSEKCGCGPNLRWCLTGTQQQSIRNAMVEQTMRFLDDIIKNQRPYTDILLAKDMEVNGPLTHYLKYQTNAGGGLLFAVPEQNYTLPTLEFHQADKWVKVERKALHSGLLTMPLYLLKFASNRGRTNRFYNAFLCTYFQAPVGGLPPASDNCHGEPNLMKRCGCKYCHQTVEPVASHWGRWAEAGLAPLNAAEYPEVSKECSQDKNKYTATCRLLYFTQPNHPDEEPYRGHLMAYVFATPEMKANITAGPAAVAKKHIDNGDFATCTTRKMWTWFVGREPLPQQEDRVLELAGLFKSQSYNLLALIKAIVTSPEYQQGRLLNR